MNTRGQWLLLNAFWVWLFHLLEMLCPHLRKWSRLLTHTWCHLFNVKVIYKCAITYNAIFSCKSVVHSWANDSFERTSFSRPASWVASLMMDLPDEQCPLERTLCMWHPFPNRNLFRREPLLRELSQAFKTHTEVQEKTPPPRQSFYVCENSKLTQRCKNMIITENIHFSQIHWLLTYLTCSITFAYALCYVCVLFPEQFESQMYISYSLTF